MNEDPTRIPGVTDGVKTIRPSSVADAPPVLRGAGATHQGKVRKYNEDAKLRRDEAGIWMIADGVGGATNGDWASAQVVDVLTHMPVAERAPDFLADAVERLYEANERMLARSRAEGGMTATTVVLLLVHGWHFTCIWAGDSRGYLLREGTLRQLTHDHSEVQALLDAGTLTPEEAERYPRSNVITRALGIAADVEFDRVADRLLPGDVFLICTDGLTKMLGDARIAAMLKEHDIDHVADALVEAALDAGGLDNVTVVAVRCEAAAGPVEGVDG